MTTQTAYLPDDDPSDRTAPDVIDITVDGTTMHIAGELDLDTAPYLFTSTVLVEQSDTPLHLDMSRVTFIDSSAIGALLQVRSDREVVIVNPSKHVQRILDITSLGPRFGLD